MTIINTCFKAEINGDIVVSNHHNHYNHHHYQQQQQQQQATTVEIHSESSNSSRCHHPEDEIIIGDSSGNNAAANCETVAAVVMVKGDISDLPGGVISDCHRVSSRVHQTKILCNGHVHKQPVVSEQGQSGNHHEHIQNQTQLQINGGPVETSHSDSVVEDCNHIEYSRTQLISLDDSFKCDNNQKFKTSAPATLEDGEQTRKMNDEHCDLEAKIVGLHGNQQV